MDLSARFTTVFVFSVSLLFLYGYAEEMLPKSPPASWPRCYNEGFDIVLCDEGEYSSIVL